MRKIFLLVLISILWLGNDLFAQKPVIVMGKHIVPKDAEKHDYHPEKHLNGYYGLNELMGSNKTSFFIGNKTTKGKTIIQYDINTLKKINEIILLDPVKGSQIWSQSPFIDNTKITT